jgi:hypothetical protein
MPKSQIIPSGFLILQAASAILLVSSQASRPLQGTVLRNDYVEVVLKLPLGNQPGVLADGAYEQPLVRAIVPDASLQKDPNLPTADVYFFQAHQLTGMGRAPYETIFDVCLKTAHKRPHLNRRDEEWDAKHNEMLLENNRVRVVRVHLNAGESTTLASRFPRVTIALTDLRAEFALVNGAPVSRDGTVNEVYFDDAGVNSMRNTGTKPLVCILVELKGE